MLASSIVRVEQYK